MLMKVAKCCSKPKKCPVFLGELPGSVLILVCIKVAELDWFCLWSASRGGNGATIEARRCLCVRIGWQHRTGQECDVLMTFSLTTKQTLTHQIKKEKTWSVERCINSLIMHTKSFPAVLGYISAWMGMIPQFCEYRCNPFFSFLTQCKHRKDTLSSSSGERFSVYLAALYGNEAKGFQWVAVWNSVLDATKSYTLGFEFVFNKLLFGRESNLHKGG